LCQPKKVIENVTFFPSFVAAEWTHLGEALEDVKKVHLPLPFSAIKSIKDPDKKRGEKVGQRDNSGKLF
jgi:hypothetical protein